MGLPAYPAYDDYKDSGVEWIGRVPHGWDCRSLRTIFAFRNEKNDPVKTGDILSLSIAQGVTPYSDAGRGGNRAKDDLTAYKLAYPGDIVLNSMNVVVGAVGKSSYFGAISPVYYALTLRSETDNDISFFERIFQSTRFQRDLIKVGKGILVKKGEGDKLNTIRMKVSTDSLKVVGMPVPPIRQQRAIAAFLDEKTAKIDEAIRIKERQIALLKERKQILIQTAVTKGLNPDVPMKDSGIDWIGEIPAHWETKPLKRLFFERNERSTSGNEILFSLRMIEGLIPHNEVSAKPISAAELVDYKKVAPGQVVMNRMRASIGIFGLAPSAGIVSPDYAVFDLKCDQHAPYFLRIFKTSKMGERFRVSSRGLGTGSSGFMRLYTDDFGAISVPVPPRQEQQEISDFIDQTADQYSAAIALKERQIATLKEYKTSLINAAVTGKIKVV